MYDLDTIRAAADAFPFTSLAVEVVEGDNGIPALVMDAETALSVKGFLTSLDCSFIANDEDMFAASAAQFGQMEQRDDLISMLDMFAEADLEAPVGYPIDAPGWFAIMQATNLVRVRTIVENPEIRDVLITVQAPNAMRMLLGDITEDDADIAQEVIDTLGSPNLALMLAVISMLHWASISAMAHALQGSDE